MFKIQKMIAYDTLNFTGSTIRNNASLSRVLMNNLCCGSLRCYPQLLIAPICQKLPLLHLNAPVQSGVTAVWSEYFLQPCYWNGNNNYSNLQ